MSLPPKDPDHWLYRFSPDEWLRAAEGELRLTREAASSQAGQRRAVAYARRAAGMALNAVLVIEPNDAWGRSYMDHLRAIAQDAQADEALRNACALLAGAPTSAPSLVRLGGGGDEGLAKAAADVVAWCAKRVG